MFNQWAGRLLRRNWGDIGLSFLKGKSPNEITPDAILKAIQGEATGLNQLVEELASMVNLPLLHQNQITVMAPQTTRPDDGLVPPGDPWVDPVPPTNLPVDLLAGPPVVPPTELPAQYPVYAPIIAINPLADPPQEFTGTPPVDATPGNPIYIKPGGFGGIFVGGIWTDVLFAGDLYVNNIHGPFGGSPTEVVYDVDYDSNTEDFVTDVQLNTSTCQLTVTKQSKTYLASITPLTTNICVLDSCS